MPFYTPHVTAAAQDYIDAIASPDPAHRQQYRLAVLSALRLSPSSRVALLDLCYEITDPKDHRFIGATNGDYRDPCRICRGRKYADQHGGVPAQALSVDIGG